MVLFKYTHCNEQESELVPEPKRLDKRLVELIHCSRGDAIKYIEGGWVMVEGEVEERPQFKVLDQQVELHENATLEPLEPVTLIFNLPQDAYTDDSNEMQQLITTENHCDNDYSGIRLLKNHFYKLQYAAPLQTGASGLMVFSKDWKVIRVLNENNKKKQEEYIVELSEEYSAEVLDQLNDLVDNSDSSQTKFKASRQSEKAMRIVFGFTHTEQLESLCNSIGLSIAAMKRIRIGRVSKKDLPPGQWRYLSKKTMF